jgi:hypothetical protein
MEQSDDFKCRICFDSSVTIENPIGIFCKCLAPGGYVHIGCLKMWMSQQRNEKDGQGNFTSYYWKKFKCEVCLHKYPLLLKSGKLTYSTVEYSKPDGDYLVLESLEQEKNESRIIHVIKPSDTKDVFKLGRGHEADLRINDISVSRCHAFIKFKKNKFLLEDNMSKFGTLVLVREKIPIIPNFNKAMQIGRTVVNFSIKQIAGDKSSKIKDSTDVDEDVTADQPKVEEGGFGALANNINLAETAVAPHHP